jgi:hypothetical protein
MDFATINVINIHWETIWQYAIGTCTLAAALLSLGFIIAVIGAAIGSVLWQTLKRIVNVLAFFSHAPRRVFRLLPFLLFIGGSLAVATFAQSSRAASVSSYLERGNTRTARGEYQPSLGLGGLFRSSSLARRG